MSRGGLSLASDKPPPPHFSPFPEPRLQKTGFAGTRTRVPDAAQDAPGRPRRPTPNTVFRRRCSQARAPVSWAPRRLSLVHPAGCFEFPGQAGEFAGAFCRAAGGFKATARSICETVTRLGLTQLSYSFANGTRGRLETPQLRPQSSIGWSENSIGTGKTRLGVPEN